MQDRQARGGDVEEEGDGAEVDQRECEHGHGEPERRERRVVERRGERVGGARARRARRAGGVGGVGLGRGARERRSWSWRWRVGADGEMPRAGRVEGHHHVDLWSWS